MNSARFQGSSDLDEVGVPGILRYPKVVVALLLRRHVLGFVHYVPFRRSRTFFVGCPKTCPIATIRSARQSPR